MDSDVTQAYFYKAYEWAETHKKHVALGIVAVLVIGFAGGFFIWYQNAKERDAGAALSRVTSSLMLSTNVVPAEEYLKVADEFPKTAAAGRAVLLGASAFFTQGKYSESKATFERFLRENRDPALMGQAQLGIAASLEAMGNADQAATAYKDLADRRQSEPVGLQARLALARLFESQGKLEQARDLYLEIARLGPQAGPFAQEAGESLQHLLAKHPELIPQSLMPPPASPASSSAPPGIIHSTNLANP